jgi:hypothetical protein
MGGAKKAVAIAGTADDVGFGLGLTFENLDSQWNLFLTLLEAYKLEKVCGSVTQGRTKPTKAKAPEPKPSSRVKPQPALTLTELVEAADLANHVFRPEHQLCMAEILRAHGHVPEVRP